MIARTRLSPDHVTEFDEEEEESVAACTAEFARESALRLDKEIAAQLKMIRKSLVAPIPNNMTLADKNRWRKEADDWVMELGAVAGARTYKQLSALFVAMGANRAPAGGGGGGGGHGGGRGARGGARGGRGGGAAGGAEEDVEENGSDDDGLDAEAANGMKQLAVSSKSKASASAPSPAPSSSAIKSASAKKSATKAKAKAKAQSESSIASDTN